MNNRELIHHWAHQTKSRELCSNVSYVGRDLFSYRACIGRILPNGAAAVSNHHYSNTTTKHQSLARSATSHMTTYLVAYPDSVSDSLNSAKAEIKSLTERAAKARSKASQYLGEALKVANQFNGFAAACGASERIVFDPGMDLAELRKQIQEQERAAAKKLKERRAAKLIEDIQKIAAWKAGEDVYPPRDIMALRIKDGNVQTSLGASFPVDHAKRVWVLIQRAVRTGKMFVPDPEKSVYLGVYKLTKIREDGTVLAGCHTVPYSESKEIAEKLELTDDPKA
jgi:hypothetical protein